MIMSFDLLIGVLIYYPMVLISTLDHTIRVCSFYGFDSYQTIKFDYGFSLRFRITLTSSRVEWTTKEMNRELELIGTRADVVASCLIAEIGNASCPTCWSGRELSASCLRSSCLRAEVEQAEIVWARIRNALSWSWSGTDCKQGSGCKVSRSGLGWFAGKDVRRLGLGF